MRLFKNEFKKVIGAKTVAALIVALLIASAVTCFYFTSDKKTAYSAEDAEIIKQFYNEFSDDSEAYGAFVADRKKAAQAIAVQINQKYTEALEKAGDDKKAAEAADEEYMKALSDPATFKTYIYSEKISDDVLISAFDELSGVKERYEIGVALILSQAEQNANELRREYGMTPDDPLYQYQIYSYNKYKNVSDNAVVGEEFVYGWDKLLTYTYGDIFLFAALILFVGAVYFTDRQSGMTVILRSCRNGRLQLAAAKTGAVCVGAAALTLAFTAIAYLTVLLRCGYSDPSVSVQNIAALALFPETLTVTQYFAYSVLIKILSAVSFSAILALLAAVIRSIPVYYLSGAAVFGAMFVCGTLDTVSYPILRLNLFSVCNFIPITQRLYIFQPFTGCLGYHLFAPVLCAAVTVIFASLAAALGAGVRHAFKPKKAFTERIKQALEKIKRKNALKKRNSEKFRKSLFFWETEKTVGRTSVLILIAALFALQIAVTVIMRIQNAPAREQRIYAKFILSEASGPFSEQGEKVKTMISVYTDSAEYADKLKTATENGVFTAEQAARIKENAEFIFKNELNDDFGCAYEVYYRNEKLYDEGIDAEFIDESGIAPVLTGGASYPLYAAVIIVCISAWTVEYGGKSRADNFANILFAAKNGRARTYFAKLGSALAVNLILSLLFYAAELVILLAGRNVECMPSPLCSVGAYAEAGINMTVGSYLTFVCVFRFVSTILLTAVSLSASALLKNFAAAFGAITGITLLPTLLYKSGLEAAGYISYGDFQSVNGMVLFSSSVKLFDKPLGAFTLYAAAFASAIALPLIISGYKTIRKRRTL